MSISDALFSSLESSELNGDSKIFSEEEIQHLQGEILKQSCQVEEYISSTANIKDNQQLKALRYLFKLFKSELSINLTLRKALVNERTALDKTNAGIAVFFDEMQNIFHTEFDNLDSVVEICRHLLKHQKKLHDMKEALKQQANEISIYVDTKTKLENEINVIQTKFEAAQSRIEDLARENDSLKESHQKTMNDFETHKIAHEKITKEKSDLEQKLKETINEKSDVEEKFNVLLSEKKILSQKLNEAKKEIETHKEQYSEVVSQLTEFQFENQKSIAESDEQMQKLSMENGTLRSQINDLKSQASLSDNLKLDISNRDNLIREMHKKCNQYRKQIDKFSNSTKELNQEIISLKSELAKSNDNNESLKNDNELLADTIEKIRKSSKDKLKSIKTEALRTIEEVELQKEEQSVKIDNLKQTIETLKIEFEKRENDLRRSLGDAATAEAAQKELLEREMKYQIEELQSQNRALKQQIRSLSYSLEKEEAELARLQVVVEANAPGHGVPLNRRFIRPPACPCSDDCIESYSDYD